MVRIIDRPDKTSTVDCECYLQEIQHLLASSLEQSLPVTATSLPDYHLSIFDL